MITFPYRYGKAVLFFIHPENGVFFQELKSLHTCRMRMLLVGRQLFSRSFPSPLLSCCLLHAPPPSNPSIHSCSLALCGESAVTVCPSSCGPSCLSQMGPSPPHPPWAMMSIRGGLWTWSDCRLAPKCGNLTEPKQYGEKKKKKCLRSNSQRGTAQIYKALLIVPECKYFFSKWLSFDLQQLHSVRFTGLPEPENGSFLCAIVRVIIRVHAQRLVGRGSAC